MTPEGVVVVRLVVALLALESLVRLVAAHVQLQAALRAKDALQKRRGLVSDLVWHRSVDSPGRHCTAAARCAPCRDAHAVFSDV